MKKKIVVTCLSVLFTSLTYAQDEVVMDDDSVQVDYSVQTDEGVQADAFDMPEGMLISEDELMKESANINTLSEGMGTSRVLSYDDSVLVSRLSRIPTTIEMPLNDVTRKFIDTYSTRMKSSVAIMLGAANFYNPIFEEALERYGLPLELRYLPVIESALRPSATSRAGAAGLWQFMISTGKRYGLEVNTLVDERRDPIKSSEAAAHYLSDLYDMFGDWSLAIAAYNCGEGNVQKAITRSGGQDGADFWSVYNRLPRETRGYVPAFIAATYIMNYYCEHGIVPHDATLPLESDTVVVAREVSFAQIASKCHVSVDELRAINPQYRKDIVPADYTLRLPAGSIEDFLLYEDSIYGGNAKGGLLASGTRRLITENVESTPVEQTPTTTTRNVYTNNKKSRSTRSTRTRKQQQTRNVSVKSGDTLSSIAKKNGTTVTKLRQLNGIKGDMIRPGQKVRVK
ncbi:MAG: transglycosylase SLT domain-containing protein [Bacteroidaceae bacterium]|nr:transglycosylase SLT domain-containing protein [Bacteroidaceae bacterium]